MTTWVNSQFPRPDFHRQVQRHYGLQTQILTLSDPAGQRSRTQNPKGEEVVDLELGLFTWTACMGMKVSDFYVLAVPGTRTEWSEIKDRVDLAAVATPVRLHSRGRSVWRWRYRKGNLNPRIATTGAPAKVRSRFPGAGPRQCPEHP